MFFLFGESVSSLRVKQLSYLNVIKNSLRIQLHLQPVLLSHYCFFQKILQRTHLDTLFLAPKSSEQNCDCELWINENLLNTKK